MATTPISNPSYQNTDNPTNTNNAGGQAVNGIGPLGGNPTSNVSQSPATPTSPTTASAPSSITPPTSTIDASTLGSSTPIQSPAATPTSDGSQVDANGNVVVQGAGSFVNALQTYTLPPDNPTLATAEGQQTDLSNRLAALQGEEETKGTATAAEYASTGVNTAMQNMTNLYNNLQTRTAQFNEAEENSLEGSGSGSLESIAQGAEGVVQRQAAVELGVDTAVYNAANNNYTTAKAIADQTIAFQFQPIEQAITDTQTLLTNNATNLSVGEQKQAQIVQGSLALQQAQIDQAKTDRSTSMSIMTDAAQSGLTDPATLKAIANADPGTAASMAAPYLSFQYLQGLYLAGLIPQPTPPGVTPPTQSNQTPAVANNNPGNLKDPKTGQFMQFPSMQQGMIALQQDLYAKGTGTSTTGLNGNSTLAQFASIYAPSSDGNDPTSYAANIASTLGVPVTTKIGTLVSDPTTLKKFANAVSLEEDPTANSIVNGTQQINAPVSPQTQTNQQTSQNIISSAPVPFQADLKTVNSTGDVFSIAAAGTPSAIWATAHNIPTISPGDYKTLQGIDSAVSQLQSLQANFASVAPTSLFGKYASGGLNYADTLMNNTKGRAIDTYNNTALVATAGALGDITTGGDNGSSATKLLNSDYIQNALPKISGGSLLGALTFGLGTMGGRSDTVETGNDKINALLSTLNSTYKSILPNSQGIQPIQTPTASASSPRTYSLNGQTWIDNGDGTATLQTQ